ncbi:C-GCAxxG-C-C family protein [bacterium]|nr:C-GCAxxG-C-C family protein [bacterium]
MKPYRRTFLAGLGGLALGTVLGSNEASTALPGEIPELPWPYEKLDIEETRRQGHMWDYRTNCASGAFIAIISQLREKVGHPWTLMPLNLYAYGGGGIVGWGTICGALNGAAGAINLAAGPANQGRLVNELLGWYTEQPFPGDTANRYGVEHTFLVAEYRSDKALTQSVSGSPLCHVSLSRWCAASGLASGSPEAGERCARLCGDVAAKAVELLNAFRDNTFSAVFVPRKETEQCMSCHHVGPDVKAGNTTTGKLNCLNCHEPHR